MLLSQANALLASTGYWFHNRTREGKTINSQMTTNNESTDFTIKALQNIILLCLCDLRRNAIFDWYTFAERFFNSLNLSPLFVFIFKFDTRNIPTELHARYRQSKCEYMQSMLINKSSSYGVQRECALQRGRAHLHILLFTFSTFHFPMDNANSSEIPFYTTRAFLHHVFRYVFQYINSLLFDKNVNSASEATDNNCIKSEPPLEGINKGVAITIVFSLQFEFAPDAADTSRSKNSNCLVCESKQLKMEYSGRDGLCQQVQYCRVWAYWYRKQISFSVSVWMFQSYRIAATKQTASQTNLVHRHHLRHDTTLLQVNMIRIASRAIISNNVQIPRSTAAAIKKTTNRLSSNIHRQWHRRQIDTSTRIRQPVTTVDASRRRRRNAADAARRLLKSPTMTFIWRRTVNGMPIFIFSASNRPDRERCEPVNYQIQHGGPNEVPIIHLLLT